MARIRTIKPEFWSDEKLGPMAPLDRLVFLGLISMADDAGRLLASVKVIDAFIFPYTSDTARESLANLSRLGRVEVGSTASGQYVLQVSNWKAHQRVDHPNFLAALPPITTQVDGADYFSDGYCLVREKVANDSRDIPEALATLSTIYDLRSTTNDPRAPAERAKRKPSRTVPVGRADVPDKVTWLTPYIELWESLAGAVEPGMLAKHVGPAHKAIGPQRALQALRRFLENGDARYGSQSFARSFRNWDGEGGSASGRKIQRVLDDFLAEGDHVPEAEFTIEGEAP